MILANQKDYKKAIGHARKAIFKAKQANSQSGRELLRWVYPCQTIIQYG